MRRALSLSELAARLQVSARAIWQLFLVFPRFLQGEYEHGPYLLLSPAMQDRVVSILDLKRKGWSEEEVRSWLERTVETAAVCASGDIQVAPGRTGSPAAGTSPATAVSTGLPLKARIEVGRRPEGALVPSQPSTGVSGPGGKATASKPPTPPVEEELLVWKRLVDLAIQPFLGRIDALARDVRSVRRF